MGFVPRPAEEKAWMDADDVTDLSQVPGIPNPNCANPEMELGVLVVDMAKLQRVVSC